VSARKPFRVTDEGLDAPDGAVVDGYVRQGSTWEPIDDTWKPCVCGHSADAHPSSYERVNPERHSFCAAENCGCLRYRPATPTERP
jgi:hypothetical protein